MRSLNFRNVRELKAVWRASLGGSGLGPQSSGQAQMLEYAGVLYVVTGEFGGPGAPAPHAHVLHLKNEDFSRDPRAVAAMNADPLIAHETQPTQTVAEMVRSDERLKEEFPLIALPLSRDSW